MQCEDIIAFLELEAPLFLQEEYDNSGLQWGNPEKEIEKVLICLDFSQEALKTAIKEKAQFIISHHPILFKPMKQIHTGFGKGAMLADCIREDICVYAAHTNFDAAGKGLNEYLAKKLDLLHISGLNLHFREALYKLVVFIPAESLEKVQDAVYKAGAGWIGNYSDCGFSVKGIGTFKPLKGTNPYVGKQGELETVDEYRLETVVPEHRLNDVVKSMLEAHPYEEAAYDMYRMEKKGYEYSLGRVGNLKKSMKTDEFVQYVKNRLQAPNVRTVGNRKDVINRVAVFCGSFDGDIKALLQKKADALVTGDLEYHDAQELEEAGIFTVDAGHYHTEKLFIQVISDILKKRFKDVIIIEHYGKDIFDFR